MKTLLFSSLFFFSLLLFPVGSNAVVKRHDVPAKNYQLQSLPEYMIDMRHEGHGVLIDSQWIVTVAHTIFYDYVGHSIEIGGKAYEIEQVHIHPKYAAPGKALFKGDLAPLMSFYEANDDIALIKLTSPVTGVKPIEMYAGDGEKGQTISVFGRGATGNGLIGEDPNTKQLRQVNYFQNVIEKADDQWLVFKFDEPENALPLEGMHGSGDSGGASIMLQDGTPVLVGLSSWQLGHGDIAEFKGGLYGTMAYQVRISHYRDWILSVIGNS